LIGGLNAGPTTQSPPPPPAVQQEEQSTIATTTPDLTEIEIKLPTLQILSTGLGYLNVRDKASTGGEIITKVYPEETYEYTDEQDGWYEIILNEDEVGWVFGKYIKLME